MAKELTLLEGLILDEIAAGRTPREIAAATGITPAEASRMAYELLDREIITDAEQRRKLQVYRLEKLINALWDRTMKQADSDDVKNVVLILQQINELLALNKETEAEHLAKMYEHQSAVYMQTISMLIQAFRAIAPHAFETDAEWAEFTVVSLGKAQEQLEVEGIPE